MLSKKGFWLILVSQIIFLSVFVFFRLIDFDEGSYLSSAYLVKCGKLPYLDFFFPQMPYLPYVYALVSSYGFSSLYFGRLISLVTGVFLSVLIFYFGQRFFRDKSLSLCLFFLYSFNGLVLSWHSVVKTIVFSDLFGFISFVFFIFYLLSRERKLNLLGAGFFVGIALNFRLTLFLILLIEGVMILVLPPYYSLKKRFMDIVLSVSAALLASPLAIYLFFRNSGAFVFGNIGFHRLWGLQVIRMTVLQKLYTFSKFLFLPQNLFIITLATVSIVWLIKRLMKERRLTLQDEIIVVSFTISLTMIVTAFLLSPTELQYYEQALPYLVISSVPALVKLVLKLKERKFIYKVSVVLYLLFAFIFVVVFIFAIRPKDAPFTIVKTKEVVEVVKENSSPGEVILSGWPGYVVFAKRESVPGMETFGWAIVHLLYPEHAKNFRLLDRQSISEVISERKVNIIIEDMWFLSDFEELIKTNYRLLKTTPFAKIYVTKNEKKQVK